MSNNDMDSIFEDLRALSLNKGYLLFEDLERIMDGLPLNEVDWLTNRLLMAGVDIFDDVPDTIKNGLGLNHDSKCENPVGPLLFLKYKTLKAIGRMIVPKGFVVYKDSEHNEDITSSCTVAIENKRHELMRLGKMKNGILTEDIKFGSSSTAEKVLIGNSVNGKKVRVDSNGYTLKQLLDEEEKRVNGE